MKRIYVLIFLLVTIVIAGCDTDNKKDVSETITKEAIEITESVCTEDISEITSTDEETADFNTDYKDPEIAAIYREVLKSERPFIMVDEGDKEILLKDYSYYRCEKVEELWIWAFFLRDINDDGNYEVIIQTTTPEEKMKFDFLILNYEDGKVYSYLLPYWMRIHGDNIVRWDSMYITHIFDPHYSGEAKISIKDKMLVYEYVFEKQGSDEEKWLVNNDMLNENDSIEYVGEEYNQYEYPLSKRWSSHELTDENIDKYVR